MVGYYDCISEEFVGEMSDDMKRQAVDAFKGALEHGRACALVKVNSTNEGITTITTYSCLKSLTTAYCNT